MKSLELSALCLFFLSVRGLAKSKYQIFVNEYEGEPLTKVILSGTLVVDNLCDSKRQTQGNLGAQSYASFSRKERQATGSQK